MPDVLTHLLVGVSIALLVVRDDNRIEQMMIILGALIIDIERPFTWLLQMIDLGWLELTSASHSIVGALVLSYFAASCFFLNKTIFKRRFILIFIGCASHLILDLVMYPWAEIGLYLLYPVKIVFSFNFLWPDAWLYPVFGLAFFLITVGIKYLDMQSKLKAAIV
jgi:membrane-bound metal-dependent hydrolase YbcI (DUF457 family)